MSVSYRRKLPTERIAGYLFDNTEASALVGKSSYKLPEIRGRALVKTGNVNIMQIYTMVKFENDIEYNRKIKELIETIAAKYPGRRAPRSPVRPWDSTPAGKRRGSSMCRRRMSWKTLWSR